MSPSPSPAPNDYTAGSGPLAAWAYANGTDPIDWAIKAVHTIIDVATTVYNGRIDNPEAFPGYGPVSDDEELARRIVGAILEAGWTPPAVKEPA